MPRSKWIRPWRKGELRAQLDALEALRERVLEPAATQAALAPMMEEWRAILRQ